MTPSKSMVRYIAPITARLKANQSLPRIPRTHLRAFYIVQQLLFCSLAAIGAESNPTSQFDPAKAPTQSEWQLFNKMSQAQLHPLWNFHAQRGYTKLSDWAWQWRMGWLRQCESTSAPKYCLKILEDGLRDDAMVVRAEAALRIGNRYSHTHHDHMIVALEKAYKNPQNFRNNNPLFVCERILEALRKIASQRSLALAEKLAASHAQTRKYWLALNKHDSKLKTALNSTPSKKSQLK